MIYFISDPHFGHENIIRLCERPFTSVSEMDNAIEHAWNKRVRSQDTIYILGDLFFRYPDPEAMLKCLKGQKHLILGNHDRSWYKKDAYSKYFVSVDKYVETHDRNHAFTLCHYPMMAWNRDSKQYMIFGHIHNSTNLDFWPVIAQNEKMLNACVEVNGYQPVTFDEMVANNKTFKEKHSCDVD